jgi:hypothetical protein
VSVRKMRISSLWTSLATLSFTTSLGCSSATSPGSGGSGDGGGSVTLTCDNSTSGQECVIYRNLTEAEATTQSSTCTASVAANGVGGTIVAACPTTNLLGCCNITTSETCSYSGQSSFSAAHIQASCMTLPGATWSTTP